MKIKLLFIGKESLEELQVASQDYIPKINNYNSFEIEAIPYLKNTKSLSIELQKKQEGELFLKKITVQDVVVLLDEHGKEYSSIQFSQFIQQRLNSGCKNVLFLIGGAYGFSEELYRRANFTLSMSKMTFPHKLARLLFIEQLYRTFTILKGEPYHHE
ncbi:MAG: 23S rRNA (pseudouridine(1915)-N(3))-methyltransferase RlmH [Bacteroidetes bacterium]|nr:23S rRNA (pseudouridine(1915)-N(3))-methyltransferase RlmH [Bacteroidota bacterium]MCL2301637.1 23S rRNA (pseudouridine(1915)-N(3))-methyltransferase RlmH [Lentimicrobiaceae bacterium]